jgi:hypothetical protein
MSAVLREAIRSLSIEQIQQAVEVLQQKANTAAEDDRVQDSIMLLMARNEMIHELERRASEEEGGSPARPMCNMGVTSHFAIRVLSSLFPEENIEQLVAHSENSVRTLWNNKFVWPESQATEAWPQEYLFDTQLSTPPVLRPVSPLAIVCFEGEEPCMFETGAPPINVWWAAEDRIQNSPIGSWELVWRQHCGDMIHEGWVQNVSEGGEDVCRCLHYLTRYRGGTSSPLPLLSE